MQLIVSRFRQIITQHSYKLLLTLLTLLLVTVLITNYVKTNHTLNCFKPSVLDKESTVLEDILLSSRQPRIGKSIFFHETSCSPDNTNKLKLSKRQACAIESAALSNPNLDIFVLFASLTQIYNISSQPLVDLLLSYPNVHLRSLNLWTYSENTPVKDWLDNGELFSSKYMLSHISDFLRYLTLWRWGGTYLDLDVIVKKSLEAIHPNYAGAESDTYIAAGVMNFDATGLGHEMAELCLRDFQINFDGDDWGNNGPGVITRVLRQICNTQTPVTMTRDRCFGFHVYPKEAFYAVRWKNWSHFFEPAYMEKTLQQTKNSYIAHLWNKYSATKLVKVGSDTAFSKLAQAYCPKVYSSSGEYF